MQKSTAARRPPRVAFIRRGGLSHSNPSLLAALRRARPDFDFVDIDLDAFIRRDPLFRARCVIGALREYGPGSLWGVARLRYRMLRNAAAYDSMRARILRRLAGEDWLCTIQTQSLWNGATGRQPHLVYTDHASRARAEVDWDDGNGAPSARWLEREAKVYLSADHVFTYGSNIRDILIARYGVPTDRVSCGGTGPNIVPMQTPSTDRARYARRAILFVGFDWERKGGPTLLAAFRRLKDVMPDATLTIVGPRPAEAEGVPGVALAGRVNKRDLEDLYHRASCFCTPSRMEPFGNVFVEALHFALPVVATRIGGIGDVVVDGVNGRRIPPGDAEALAEALRSVLADPDATRSMGEASLARAADFTWDLVATRILDRAPRAATG